MIPRLSVPCRHTTSFKRRYDVARRRIDVETTSYVSTGLTPISNEFFEVSERNAMFIENIYRSSRLKVFLKISVLKTLENFQENTVLKRKYTGFPQCFPGNFLKHLQIQRRIQDPVKHL